MKLLTEDQLRTSQGIGASEVACVLHLDPWRSAYQLWAQKTGRVPKPERTAAMLYGIEKEPEAFALYKQVSGRADMQTQVAAEHGAFPFLRCIADGWDGKHGVEIKCPSSPKLFESVSEGTIPTHYLLQLAACMDCFGVGAWDFFVYRAGGEYVQKTVTMGDPHPGYTSLNDYWREIAIPALVDFNQRIEEDRWLEPDFTPTIDEKRWREAVADRNHAAAEIERFDEAKSDADARLKQMLGWATRATCAGWRASWTRWKPTYELSIKVASEEKLAELSNALETIQGANGILEVKVSSKPENYVFKLQPEAGSERAAGTRKPGRN